MNRKQRFSDEELWSIANKHRNALTSASGWNRYAKENGLPHSQTFIQRFGSWNELKKQLSLKLNEQHRPIKYQVDELISILQKHSSAYTSINAWNQYASKHQLPNHYVFDKYLGEEKLKELTGFIPPLTDKGLKSIILKYFPDRPPTVTEWTMLTRKEQVPSVSTIIRRFNSWAEMKRKIYDS